MVEPAVPGDGGLARFRLDVAYDGTDFSGWAAQPDRRTVAGVLTKALSRVVRRPVALTVAGRTDAGVHATGQVASADLPADLDPEGALRRLARMLPADVRVTAITVVSPETTYGNSSSSSCQCRSERDPGCSVSTWATNWVNPPSSERCNDSRAPYFCSSSSVPRSTAACPFRMIM